MGKRSVNGIPVLRPAVTKCADCRQHMLCAMLLLICILVQTRHFLVGFVQVPGVGRFALRGRPQQQGRCQRAAGRVCGGRSEQRVTWLCVPGWRHM